MEFLSIKTERGVTERRFDLKVGDESVPGILWTPEGASGNRPLVLLGHGGTQHKRVENVLALARTLVRHQGYAAVAIDAPGHGDRGNAEAMARLRERIVSKQFTPEQRRDMESRHALGAVEWKATLDAMERLPEIGQGAVGYWGLSMGTFIGVPFIAAEPRVKCAVLGLAGSRQYGDALESAARSITIPLLFLFQLNDELMTPESGLALFSAFGSSIKTMHLNPGPHVGVPPFEREYCETFFVRHLGQA
jgi:dienelactone hydrolase